MEGESGISTAVARKVLFAVMAFGRVLGGVVRCYDPGPWPRCSRRRSSVPSRLSVTHIFVKRTNTRNLQEARDEVRVGAGRRMSGRGSAEMG